VARVEQYNQLKVVRIVDSRIRTSVKPLSGFEGVARCSPFTMK